MKSFKNFELEMQQTLAITGGQGKPDFAGSGQPDFVGINGQPAFSGIPDFANIPDFAQAPVFTILPVDEPNAT